MVFPDVSHPPQTIEFEHLEAVGREDLSLPISRSILRGVTGQSSELGSTPRGEGSSVVREIRQFLCPDSERVVVRPGVIAETERLRVSLTEDRYQVLDTIADNDRCLIEGTAGTGKTVLALEYAGRCSRNGERAMLLCFDRLLGDWLADQTAEFEDARLVSGSPFRFLRNLILSSSYGTELGHEELRG
jgi:hypothetical protein